MSQIGLSAHSIAFESQATSIERDEKFNVDHYQFEVRNVSGIAAAPNFDMDIDFSEVLTQRITVAEFAPALGEWTAIAERSHTPGADTSDYLIFNDEFGYSPVFYAQIPGIKTIISDSFQGVVYELMRNGITPTLNLESYITSVITKDSRFANPLAWQTHSADIHLLPPHKAIHVTANTVKIINRKSLLHLPGLDSGALIDQGIEFVKGTLKRLAANKTNSHSLLLSGGVDSRVVLALVLAAGVDDTFAIRSNDPRNYKNKYSYKVFEDDFFISYAIGRHFGLNWLPPRSTSFLKTSIEEGARISQPSSSNFSHTFPATPHHSIYQTPEISLRGGGGEPIKGAGFLSLVKQVQNYSNLSDSTAETPFNQFRKWYVDNAIIDSSFEETAYKSLGEIQQWLRTDSFEDLMPSYYQHCRNRTHFGHAKFSASTNLFAFQPLSNSYFYAASEAHNNSELQNYKIARHIFAATAPTLLDFPFEDPEATQLLTSGSGASINRDSKILESHFSTIAKQKPTVNEITFPGTTQELFPRNKNEALISLCRTLANELEDAFPEHRAQLKAVHKAVFEALELGVLNPGLTVGRMLSARDVYFPTSAPGQSIQYHCTAKSTIQSSIGGLRDPDALQHLKRPSIAIKPPVVLNPKARRTDNRILVEANPESTRPASLEFAFYLLENGKAVQRTAYQDDQTMTFEVPKKQIDAHYAVKCYVRYQGVVAPCAIKTTTLV